MSKTFRLFLARQYSQLSNLIERAVVLDSTHELTPKHLLIDSLVDSSTTDEDNSNSNNINLPTGLTLHELEKLMIIETLKTQHHNRTKTAEVLGISLSTLRNKINQYNL